MKAAHRIELWRGGELLSWISLCCLALIVPLLVGQLLRLRAVLWPLNEESLTLLVKLIQGGSLIVLEIALPIASLIATTICVRRWRSSGEIADWFSLGGSPLLLIRPILIISTLLSTLNIFLSTVVTPQTIRGLKNDALEVSQSQWRRLIPNMMSKTQPNFQAQEGEHLVHWLIESERQPNSKHATFTQGQNGEGRDYTLICCLVKSASARAYSPVQSREITSINMEPIDHPRCIHGWWRAEDEGAETLVLQDLKYQSSSINVEIGRAEVPIHSVKFKRIEKTFGPPNSLDQSSLNQSIHHRFIYFKRIAIPIYCLILAIIGVWAGMRLSLRLAISVGLASLTIAFGLMRWLELCSRAGLLPPVLATFLPLISLSFFSIFAIYSIFDDSLRPI